VQKRTQRLAIIVFFLVAVAAGLWQVSLIGGPERELRSSATVFIARIGEGRASEAWEDAAQAFKEAVPRAEFLLLADDMGRGLGGFQQLGTVRKAKTQSGAGVAAGELEADFVFAKRTVPGLMTFALEREKWRVTRMDLAIPDEVWGAPDQAALIAGAQKVAEAVDRRDLGAVYGSFYPSLQAAWKPSEFDRDMKSLHAGCGASQIRSQPRVVGTSDAGKTLVETTFGCADTPGFVLRQEWMFRRGLWRLMALHWGQIGR
jgi:hypothetical protein